MLTIRLPGGRGFVRTIAAVEFTRFDVTRRVAIAVTNPRRRTAGRTVGHWPRQVHALSVLSRVKVGWRHGCAKHDVVVHVDETIGEAGYAARERRVMRMGRGEV